MNHYSKKDPLKNAARVWALGFALLFMLLILLLMPLAMHAQQGVTNTFNVAQFAGADVGAKITAAQNQCLPNTAIPCTIIIDSILAVWPQGNIPAACSNCLWIDYRISGAISFNGAAVGQVNGAVSVKSFGAKGDGSTDDTTAINNALSSTSYVYFPDGTYMVNATSAGQDDPTTGGIAPPNNSMLLLSKNATIKALPNSTGFYNVVRLHNVSNVRIVGGTVDGNRSSVTAGGATQYGYGVMIAGSTDVWIEGTVFQNCWGDGIFVRRNSALSTRSQRIHVLAVKSDGNRRQGMSLIDVLGMQVSDSIFSNTAGSAPQNGIDVEPGGSGNAVSEVQFTGNKLLSNTGRGIALQGQAVTDVSNIVLTGNQSKSNGAAGFVLVVCKGVTLSNNVSISDNTSAADVAGIYLSDAGLHLIQNVTITGGFVTGNTQNGYGLFGDHVTVSGTQSYSNTLAGYAAGGGADAISDLNIEGNISFLNGTHGFSLANGITDGNFTGNVAHSNSQTTNLASSNFLFTVTTSMNVTDNTARKGSQANVPGTGMNLNTTSNMYVANNDLLNGGGTNDLITGGSTGLVLFGNRTTAGPPIQGGTATMTTAAITAGNCGTTVTVAASGVVTTDTIIWAFSAAPAGSNAGLVAWPTAGNVNFAYCPNSAETPAAATINWKVVR